MSTHPPTPPAAPAGAAAPVGAAGNVAPDEAAASVEAAGIAASAGTTAPAGAVASAGAAGAVASAGAAASARAAASAATAEVAKTAETAEVRRFWRDLGLPGLVDVHTHFMPERVLHKVWAYFDGLGPLTGGIEWPITYRKEEGERAALLRAFGVRAFTAMLYPHKPGMARWLNDWAAGFARRTPDCLHTSTFFPEPGAAAYVREAVEHGTRVFKAHVQVGGYDPSDEALDACWGLLAEAGTPVVVHCGSGPAPGKHTGPEPVARVLARHPRLRLVVAHMGMPEYEDFLGLAERYREVRLDTTMAFTGFSERMAPFPRRALPRLAALGDRVLLGTDFPNIPYPYAHQLDALADLGLGDDWLRAVCHDNAARLFGLPDVPEPPA
ncbi:amidohydrolase family protein [Streptomyces albogriseolus]|uniref:amidohydrolase family protein n=1 Tax=Streptomyces albogriseolus TaxID=1887 RepID=UPI003F4E2EC0